MWNDQKQNLEFKWDQEYDLIYKTYRWHKNQIWKRFGDITKMYTVNSLGIPKEL